ncbi:MAG: hypothetical protein CV088_20875 [Nitrospira sp. LK70]|nr:hypothetical protein [Nitrospira sp. LK70]
MSQSLYPQEFNRKWVARKRGGGAYSDPSQPLIPTQVGHPFRRNAATDSEVNPATFPSPLGIGGRHLSESGAG